MFQIKKNPRKIAILGTGSGWELFPKASDHTVYCLNDYIRTERYGIQPDILFILDVLDEKPQIVAGMDNLGTVIQKINSMKVPLIAPFKYEEIPLSQPFPLKEVYEKFGWMYFSNTISYMIAYALLQGAEEIDLYGINQASSSEYFHERDSVTYWLGIAVGMGVKVTINGEKSELLINKRRYGGNLLYGYNMTFQEIQENENKFGEQVVKKLSGAPNPYSRSISRKINHSS